MKPVVPLTSLESVRRLLGEVTQGAKAEPPPVIEKSKPASRIAITDYQKGVEKGAACVQILKFQRKLDRKAMQKAVDIWCHCVPPSDALEAYLLQVQQKIDSAKLFTEFKSFSLRKKVLGFSRWKRLLDVRSSELYLNTSQKVENPTSTVIMEKLKHQSERHIEGIFLTQLKLLCMKSLSAVLEE
jgi:hypothetical protein